MSSMPPPPPPPPPSYGTTPPPGYQPYQQMQQTPQFASWGTRVGGYLINALVGVLFYLPALIVSSAVSSKGRYAVVAILGIVGLVAYYVMYSRMVARTGQAWGHKAVGVRIVDANTGGNIGAGKAFLRFTVGHLIDGLPCYLGYLWPLWDANKQTFADKIFSTYSIKV